jgi:hypothetical protein
MVQATKQFKKTLKRFKSVIRYKPQDRFYKFCIGTTYPPTMSCGGVNCGADPLDEFWELVLEDDDDDIRATPTRAWRFQKKETIDDSSFPSDVIDKSLDYLIPDSLGESVERAFESVFSAVAPKPKPRRFHWLNTYKSNVERNQQPRRSIFPPSNDTTRQSGILNCYVCTSGDLSMVSDEREDFQVSKKFARGTR